MKSIFSLFQVIILNFLDELNKAVEISTFSQWMTQGRSVQEKLKLEGAQ